MKLEQQCASLELCKKLKELGAKQESFFDWECRMGNWSLIWGDYHVHPYVDTADVRQYVSAFTVAELGEMLPENTTSGKTENHIKEKGIWICGLNDPNKEPVYFMGHPEYADTEADARASMLIYLLENKLITL